jgi:tetratricopeptide (TPR) repeat protein
MHLIEQCTPNRYRLHDLVKQYLLDRSRETSAPPAADANLRLLDYLVHTVGNAAAQLDNGDAIEVDVPVRSPQDAPVFTCHAQALTWLDVERPNLVRAVVYAAGASCAAHARLLALRLWPYLRLRGHLQDLVAVHEVALRTGHDGPQAQAHTELGMGCAYETVGRRNAALHHLRRALDLYVTIGDRAGEARSLNAIGTVLDGLGRYEEARTAFQRTIDIHRDRGDRQAESRTRHNLGVSLALCERYAEALEVFQREVAACRQLADREGQARALYSLGKCYVALGRYDEALAQLEMSLEMRQQMGDVRGEANTLSEIAVAIAGQGAVADGLERLRQALELVRHIEDRNLECAFLLDLGLGYLRNRHAEAAAGCYRDALAIARELEAPVETGRAYDGLARCARTRGDLVAANRYWQRAASIFDIHDPAKAGDVHKQLDRLAGHVSEARAVSVRAL